MTGSGPMRLYGPPRVLALCVPDLPVQRLRREREDREAGPPLAVLAEGRVACCEAAARAAGVRPGMSAAEALAACGGLETVLADPVADQAALRALAEAMLSLAPAVEVAPPDALLLDAGAAPSASAHPEPFDYPALRHAQDGYAQGRETQTPTRTAEIALAERARALAAELDWSVRAAVACGRGPARALARHGGRPVQWVAPGEGALALAPLPISALDLPPEVAARLAEVGVITAGALARLPPEALAHRFGATGVAAARLARGEDQTPLVPYAPAALPEEGIDLEAPVENAEPLLFALKRLADRVAARLAGRGLGATRLELVLKLDSRGEERIFVPLAQPTASAARWLVPAKERLFTLRLPAAVSGLELAAIEVAPVAPEQLAIGDRPESLAALETVLSRLAVRLGDGALFAAEPVERYKPEAAYRQAPFRPAGARAGRPFSGSSFTRPTQPRGRRKRAGTARTAGAVNEAAADPAPFRPTRLLAPPRMAVAEGEGGRITAIRVGSRAWPVLALEGPEQIAGEWWVSPFDREYYRVHLDGLGECWIYRDGADGRLWLHGFFD